MDIAHTKDGKTFTCEEECQELKCHLKNVANYSKEFASFFDGGEAGEVIGLLHDAGKYQANFQDRIRGKNIRVDHATAGAKILVEKYNAYGDLYGMAVAGHHTGLSDSGSVASMGDGSYHAKLNNYDGSFDFIITCTELIADELKNKNIKVDKPLNYIV